MEFSTMRSYIRRKKTAGQSSAPQKSSSRFGPKVLPPVKRKVVQPKSLPPFKPAENYNYTSLHEMYGHPAPVQAKLTIGEPGDVHEQQADAVASQVVQQINQPERTGNQGIQKKETGELTLDGQPQPEIQREEENSPPLSTTIQPGLSPVTSSSSNVIQRAIGLEIEVPVPVDHVSEADMTKLREWTAAEFGDTAANDPYPQFRQEPTYTVEDMIDDEPPARREWFEQQSEDVQQNYLTQKLKFRQGRQKEQWVGSMSGTHKEAYKHLGDEGIDAEKQRAAEREAIENRQDPGKVGVYKKGKLYERIEYTRGYYNESVSSSEEFGKVGGIDTVDGTISARVAIAAGPHFVAQVDHDPRVNSGKQPPHYPWRDSGNSALMEIVQNPANNKEEFDQSMDEITRFYQTVNQKTNNLTRHAQNPFGTGYNIGPFDYPNITQFANSPREDNHNWEGSVQVNVGIDLREYGDMASWYAGSKYASTDVDNPQAKGLDDEEVQAYDAARDNIIRAVEIGEEIVKELIKAIPKRNRKQPQQTRHIQRELTGNMRGIQGLVTHLALNMLGGATAVRGSSTKNVTPILMKSPNTVAIQYGFTDTEKTYYEDIENRKIILDKLVNKTGRSKKWGPIKKYYGEGLEPGPNVLSDANKLIKGGNTSIATFASPDLRGTLTGSTIHGSTPVGPVRHGNEAVSNIPSDDKETDQRGGVVVEFRQLPGLYDGPDQWREIGYDFLREAEARNRRSGVTPDRVDDLVGPEWQQGTTDRRMARM